MAPHERLRAFMKWRGLSQHALAEALGCSQPLVSSVLLTNRRFGLDPAHALETLTTDWPDGPIRTEEWLSATGPSADARLRQAAHNAVAIAIRAGRLRRPERCSVCRLGARMIEAHHDDYSKPLDVRWLCKGCHERHHHATEAA